MLTCSGYDDSSWQAATAVGDHGASPWGVLNTPHAINDAAQWIWTSTDNTDPSRATVYCRINLGQLTFTKKLKVRIASTFMRADTGLVANVILGIVGAIVANFLLRLVGISASPTWISQGLVGFAGACLIIWGARQLRGR